MEVPNFIDAFCLLKTEPGFFMMKNNYEELGNYSD